MKNPGKKNLNEYIKWLKSELKEAEAKKDAERKQIAEKEFKEECAMRRNLDSYTVEDIDRFRCSDKTKQRLLQGKLNNLNYSKEKYESSGVKEGGPYKELIELIQKIKDLKNANDVSLYNIPVSKIPFNSKYALISDSEIRDIKKKNSNKPLMEAFAAYF